METYINNLLAIQGNNYYITTGDYTYEHYEKVSKKNFIKEIEKYRNFAKDTWSKKAKEEFNTLATKFNLATI